MEYFIKLFLKKMFTNLPRIISIGIMIILAMSFLINFLLEYAGIKSIREGDLFESKYFIKEDLGLAFLYLIIATFLSSFIYQNNLNKVNRDITKSFIKYRDEMTPFIKSSIVPILIIFFSFLLIVAVFILLKHSNLKFKKYAILLKKISLSALILIFIAIPSFFNVMSIYIVEVNINFIPMLIQNEYSNLEEYHTSIKKNINDKKKLYEIKKEIKLHIDFLKDKENDLSKRENKVDEKREAINTLEKQYDNYKNTLDRFIKVETGNLNELEKIHKELTKDYENFKDNEEKNITNTNSLLLEFFKQLNKTNGFPIEFIILNILCLSEFIFFVKLFSSEKSSMVLKCKDNKRYRCLEVISKGTGYRIWELDQNLYNRNNSIDKVKREDIEGFEKVIFLQVTNLNTSLNFYKDVFGIQNEITYTDSNGKQYIRFHLFNKLFEIYESNNSNKDILKKVLEQQNIKCEIFDTTITRVILEVKVQRYIPNYNQVQWKEIDPSNRTTSKIEIKDLDGYKYILEDKK